MKKRENKLDERQEQEMLKIEHNGFWIAFWGLAAALVVQAFLYGNADFKIAAGEWLVFICIAVYMGIACIRHGIWDRRISPSPKTNLFCSAIAGCVCGIFEFVTSYRDYHILSGSAAAGVFMISFVFAICYGALSFFSFLYRKRVNRLENEDEKEPEAEEDERK